ncbi:hypothetical protein E2I00_013770 [Balaenoptera physalus]|uniref:Transmembrane protein 214 n=1 Tax=Balaenoptera physalus TaxID=9770 RepID=A0A643CIT9_BALPH|nr:hypothetical protein E2I00_013770 [Balaenoptera physalus]
MKRQNKEQVPPPAVEPKKPGNKKQTKKVATLTNQNQKQGRFRSLEEALKALDLAALQKELDKSQSVFSGNPSVWLKDLASYLNYKLQVPPSEPTLSQHTHDYPYSLVSRELRGIIRGLLAKAAESLELFFDHCLFTMLQELDKTPGESLHGYRICIQAILQDKPKIATMNLGKFLELLRSHQSRPAKCLTIMMHPNLTKGFGMIGPKDLFPLLDFAYMPNNSLTPSLQEQLCQLYPRLKVLAFGAKPESTLHTYFPSFLSRATPSCPPEMKKELLSSLTECLAVDPFSTGVWRQLYPKHALLLEHLLRSWERIPKKTQKSLQETIQSFKLTNQDLLGKGSCSNQDSLLQQARGFWLPWTRLLVLVLVFAIGFLCHDFWLEETLPAWGSHLLTMVRPSLQLAWAHTNATVSFLSAHCASHLAWLGDSLTSLSQRLQIQLPDALNQLLRSLRELLLFLYQSILLPTWHMLLEALARVQEHCHEACRGGVTWDCVKTQLSEAAHRTWLCLQDTTVAFLDWAFAMISQQ